jgi:hypothetical protein
MRDHLWMLTIGTFLVSLVGCAGEGERVAQVAREAAQRQAEQNRQMALLQNQVAEGSRRLVEAEANARAEITAMQRDLQQSQAEVGRQRDLLEAERRQIAAERYWDGIVGNSIMAGAMLLACVLPLLLCWALLRSSSHDGETDAALAEFLAQELVSAHPMLLPGSTPPPLLEQSGSCSVMPRKRRMDNSRNPTEFSVPESPSADEGAGGAATAITGSISE